jgi:hypothetical protein
MLRRHGIDGETTMKRSFTNTILLAAAGAAASWLVRQYLDHRYQRRATHAKRELKEQLRTWEDEGGALAPPRAPAEKRDHVATH